VYHIAGLKNLVAAILVYIHENVSDICDISHVIVWALQV